MHTEPSGDGVELVNVIIFLAVQQTQALLIHDELPSFGHHHHHQHHHHHVANTMIVIIIIITVITILRTPASARTTELVSRVHIRVGFRVHYRGPNPPAGLTRGI